MKEILKGTILGFVILTVLAIFTIRYIGILILTLIVFIVGF